MELYTVQGYNRKECELKITEKYRLPFQILSEKPIRIGGFMGLFSKLGVEVEFYFKNQYMQSVSHGFSGNNALQGKASFAQNLNSNFEEEKRKVIAAARKSYDQSAAAVLPENNIQANNNDATNEILNMVKEINEKIETGSSVKEEHPSFTQAVQLLKNNDFTEKYINKMTDRIRKEMTLEALDDFNFVQEQLFFWIAESISIYREEGADDFKQRSMSKIMVLIGPTGVGKSTTIAKLAAINGIAADDKSALDVRMITIDAFRIGAKIQLEQIGDIMYIPVSAVDNKNDLKKEIALHSDDIDLFLIDTFGNSPKDSSKINEMKEILEGAGKWAQYYLVIAAGTKSSDMADIMQQFDLFNYCSVIISKMDETDRIGNVISALAEKNKPVSYLTDGQDIPVYIKKASVINLLMYLDGFNVNFEKMEKRFPQGEADQFKWK